MKNNITVWEYIDGKIVSLNIDGRKVTAANYGKTKRCLRRFTDTDNLFFEDITDDFVSQFNSYLGKTNIQKSTISFYNRVLRSIYNQASKEGVVKNIHPFDGAYTKVEVKLSSVNHIRDEHGQQIDLEELPKEEILRKYQSLQRKYNSLIGRLNAIVGA